jgi:hypothetical protein
MAALGWKPFLHVCMSGDMPGLLKNEAGFGLTNFKRNRNSEGKLYFLNNLSL